MTAETWVQTSEGPRQVSDLMGRSFGARVDGKLKRTERLDIEDMRAESVRRSISPVVDSGIDSGDNDNDNDEPQSEAEIRILENLRLIS